VKVNGFVINACGLRKMLLAPIFLAC